MSSFPLMFMGEVIGMHLGSQSNGATRHFRGVVLEPWVCDLLGTAHDIKWLVEVDPWGCKFIIQNGMSDLGKSFDAKVLVPAITERWKAH